MSKTLKLTDTQLILLRLAARREDGAAIVPEQMNRANAKRAVVKLIEQKLLRDIKTKTDLPGSPVSPVWRQDEKGRPFSLVLTDAGRKAIHVETSRTDEKGTDEEIKETAPQIQAADTSATDMRNRATAPAEVAPRETASLSAQPALRSGMPPRDGSKIAQVVAMLSSNDGATIAALMEATGWLAHTTRAALTGLRKRGFLIERIAGESGGTAYRLFASPSAHDAQDSPAQERIAHG